MLAAMALFSLSDVFAKRLLSSVSAIELVWFRYLAMAATIGFLVARERSLPRSTRPAMQIGRGICMVGSTALYNVSLAFLPLATATALVFSSPLFVIVLSVLFLRERFPARRFAWPLLGFSGVLVVANPDPATFDPVVLLPLCTAGLWATAMVMTRHVAATDSALTLQTWSCGVALVLLTAFLPFGFVLPAPDRWVELAAMAFLWTTAQWLVVHAYHGSDACDVAPFAYSQLVWASLFSTVLLGQIPDPRTLVGTALILIAGAGSALASRQFAAPSRG